MIRFIMLASNNKFMMVVLSVISIMMIHSESFQYGGGVLGKEGQLIIQTRAKIFNPTVDVKLKIRIKEQRYCQSTLVNHNMLQMNLSLDFSNTGKDRVIFFKSGHRIAEYMISRTLENALAEKYESHETLFGTRDFLDDITSLINTPIPSNDFFVIISPGESYKSEEQLTIPIYNNESIKKTDLSEGEHFLVITLLTWPDIAILPDKLRGRWKEYGYLYSAPTISKPVSFRFVHSRIQPCPR